MRPAALLPVVAAAALAAGCNSQWFPGFSHSDIARTDVVIRTEPPGATIVMTRVDASSQASSPDTLRLPTPSPVRQPIEYDHVETLYERQNNYGAQMREGMHPVVQVLTFPVWAVASFFHFREEKHRHEYGNNKYVVTAQMPGRDDAEQSIVLEGEAEHPVLLKLPPPDAPQR